MQKSSFDMEKKKIVLTLSKVFPVTSSQAGEPTGFEEKLKTGVKLHTIRANKAGVWDKRAKEIAEGRKYLCVREWTGKPYHSEQREFTRFEKIGIQHVVIFNGTLPQCKVDGKEVAVERLAANDGLTLEQFKEWFFGCAEGGCFEGVIIHFTDFRY